MREQAGALESLMEAAPWSQQVLQKYHFRAQTGAKKEQSFSTLYVCTKGPSPPPTSLQRTCVKPEPQPGGVMRFQTCWLDLHLLSLA